MSEPKKRGRKPLAAEVERLEFKVPSHLAAMAREAAAREGITPSEWWRRAALLKLSTR